ncbi:unnamed protein product [Phytophthora fragariaefolia]|uniref:Unnamed protein product n=1 Tax=Phytophthora fragariaefolia TaxID=1490495 RepID=A0A9W6YC65_9STRA|nr:unnamed protein product [Phytophthora fragariaefolia]
MDEDSSSTEGNDPASAKIAGPNESAGARGRAITTTYLYYGRNPLLGPYQIVGSNDVPYPDRVIACVQRGRTYEPRLVSSLLAKTGVSAILEDATGSAVHGYRLRQRSGGSVREALDPDAQIVYEASCKLIARTISNILDTCVALGYENVTRDNLRVVDDWDSNNLYLLPGTLPVLIMPFWDNSVYARHAVPTRGGDACIFRLQDAYASADSSLLMASFRGVDQSVRHNRTIEWLDRPGGYWKNGWYEDAWGMRWYSDVTSSVNGAPYFVMFRLFDMGSGKEMDCSNPSDCEGDTHIEQWGDKFSLGTLGRKFTSVYIANATELGLFLYESYELGFVYTGIDWETVLSNLSVGLVLFRWVMALASLQMGDFHGNLPWFSGGIGCVSGASSFAYLPLVSVPRLKMTLAAFWTAGCKFEGQQRGMAEAWFIIYPAIAHLILIYCSLLNHLAKILRRRLSDVLFTPSVIFLCLMHFFRQELAESGWLKGVDSRVSTLITSDEVKKLQLIDYFSTSIMWRINGHVTLVFAMKIAVLVVNLLPLLISPAFPVGPRGDVVLSGIEKALGFRAWQIGGFGRSLTDRRIDRSIRGTSSMKDQEKAIKTPEIVFVNSYELIRFGYVVFGDKYLITFDDWDWISSIKLIRAFCSLWNRRVLIWTLRYEREGNAEIAGGRSLESTKPEVWRVDDPRLQKISWWQVSACSIQC